MQFRWPKLIHFAITAGIVFFAISTARAARTINLIPSIPSTFELPSADRVVVTISVPKKGFLTLKSTQLNKSDCGVYGSFQEEDLIERRVSEAGVNYSYDHFENTYFVQAGSYQIDFTCQNKLGGTANVSVLYELAPLVLPVGADRILAWLKRERLDRYLEITKYESKSHAAADSALDSLSQSYEEPELEVTFRIPERLNHWELIAESLDAKFGGDYRKVLLGKISLYSGIGRRRILLGFSGDCWSDFYSEGHSRKSGSVCMSASSRAALTKEEEDFLSHVHYAGALRSEITIPASAGLITLFRNRLESRFDKLGGRITLIDSDDEYLEMVVRQLRGVVIPGSKAWERIQIAISLSNISGGGRRILLQVDGNLGFGINPPDADGGYDADIEPKYSRDLNNFTRELLTYGKSVV